jgi:hypothetical protein
VSFQYADELKRTREQNLNMVRRGGGSRGCAHTADTRRC